MGYNANFHTGDVLFASALNAAFANVVNVAGDTMTGTLFLQGAGTGLNVINGVIVGSLIANTSVSVAGIDIGSGLIQASANANSALNLAQGAFNKANLGSGVQTTTFLIDVTKPGLTVNSGVNIALTGNSTLILGSNIASTTQVGVVQLNDTLTSTSTTQAATANAINTVWTTAQAAFNRANTANGVHGGNSSNVGIGFITFFANNTFRPGLTVNSGTSLTITGNNTIILGANIATIASPGVVQLNDTLTSTSTLQAATANSVNAVFNLVSLAVSRFGDTMTGKLSANGSNTGLEVANNAVIDGSLTVKGPSTVGGTLTVTGPSTLSSVNVTTLNITSSLNISGPLSAKTVTATGDITVTGNISSGTTITKVVPGNYVLSTGDSGVTLLFTSASLSTVNAIPLPVGFRVILTQIGTGNVVVQPSGGASIHPRVGANNRITGQWATASLFCYLANNYVLDGSIN